MLCRALLLILHDLYEDGEMLSNSVNEILWNTPN